MSEVTTKLVREICEYALLAPSVHNSQPWQVSIGQGQLTVRPSSKRVLKEGDPIGRQTWVSLGAFVETAVVAAEALGLAAKVNLVEKEVTVSFSSTKKGRSIPLSAIKQRFTDRSAYTNKEISDKNLEKLESCWKSSSTKVIVTKERSIIEMVSVLISKGISMALNSPKFRHELSSLIVNPSHKKKVGISTSSLGLKGVNAYIEAILIKSGSGIKHHAKLEHNIWTTSNALVFTFSKGDTVPFWFDAGRAYQRVGLTATSLGIRQATSAAIVEALDFHEDIEKIMKTNGRLLTVMRLGYSNAKPAYSPRLNLDETQE